MDYVKKLNAEEDVRLSQLNMLRIAIFGAGIVTGLMIAAWLIGWMK